MYKKSSLTFLAAMLALSACSTPEVKPTAPTSEAPAANATPTDATPAEETPAADKTETAKADSDKASTDKPDPEKIIKDLKVFAPETLGLSAPLINFGKEGFLTDYVADTTMDTWPTMNVLVAALGRGDVDMAATPSFVAANLYNKDIDVRLVASVIWGFLYVVGPEDATPGDWKQLKGKRVALMRPGNMPDLAITKLLQANGMSRDDVDFVPVPEPGMVVGMLAKGEVDWAVGMEHQMSLGIKKAAENGIKLKTVFDLQKEWGKVFGGRDGYPTLSIVMPGKLLDEHPGLAQAVVKELQASSKKVNDLDEATINALAEKHDLPKEFITKVIPRLNIEVHPAKEIQGDYETFLEQLGGINPDIYGNKLPDDKFYYGSDS